MGLLAKARGSTSGLEAEVSLVVDVMWPAKKLVKALDDFRQLNIPPWPCACRSRPWGGDPCVMEGTGGLRHQRSLWSGQ
jgi:hypothetical protein